MRFIVMFVTAVCVLFLIKLRWPKKKNFYDAISTKLLLSPKHCVDLLFARGICCAIVSNISWTHGGLHSQVGCLK